MLKVNERMDKLAEQYKKVTEQLARQATAELNAEHEAFADYFERTGKSAHILGSAEQRKLIENWKEDHQ